MSFEYAGHGARSSGSFTLGCALRRNPFRVTPSSETNESPKREHPGAPARPLSRRTSLNLARNSLDEQATELKEHDACLTAPDWAQSEFMQHNKDGESGRSSPVPGSMSRSSSRHSLMVMSGPVSHCLTSLH